MPCVIDLSNRSRIKVSGQKAMEFLNGVCSNNIKDLHIGSMITAAFLDRFAKIIAFSSISNFGDFFLIESDAGAHENLLKYLQSMADFAGCKVENIQDSYKMFSVTGFEKGLMGLDIERGKSSKKKFNTRELLIVWNAIIERVDFFVKAEEADGFPEFLYIKGGVEKKDEAVYESFRISSGMPEYRKDYDSSYTLMELGIDGLVSYTKGCYTGQEVVARMKSYGGHLPKKIVKLKIIAGSVSPKEKLFKEDIEAGFISSVAEGNALGTLKKGFFESGTEIKSDSGALVRVV